MILFLIIIFSCVALIAYSYLCYPLLLKWLTMGKQPVYKAYEVVDEWPNVFVLMSAYNEEKVIEKKINSVYHSNYPSERLHVYIGADACSDDTNSILLKAKNAYPSLQIFLNDKRSGKAGVLNQLMNVLPAAKPSDIVIFTDANVLFEKETISHLVKYFKEATIGQVGANILNYGIEHQGISRQEAYYIQRENKIKYMEGKLNGSMIGAFGACYAIRRNLVIPFPSNILMEDFYLSMSVLTSGNKAILVKEAICKEDLPGQIQDEFKRKSRISAGNYQNMNYYASLLFQPFSSVGFCYLSHKVIRWLTPFLMISMMISLLLLSINNRFIAQLSLIMVGSITFLFILDIILEKAGIHFLILRFIRYFLHMNLALLNGFFIYIKGVKTNAWTSTKRDDKSVI